jgi:hypothetical protein
MVTPIHPASYTPLVTIVAAHVRTPIAIIPIGTVLAVVAVPVAAVIAVAIIAMAICTPVTKSRQRTRENGITMDGQAVRGPQETPSLARLH